MRLLHAAHAELRAELDLLHGNRMHHHLNDAVTRWRQSETTAPDGHRFERSAATYSLVPNFVRLSGAGIPAKHCDFCGNLEGPFTRIEGLFTVRMCQAAWPCGPAAAVPTPA
jgi:hypothetical protein